MLKISPEEEIMAQVIVGKWGKSLAVRLPEDVAHAAGICAGVRVEIEAQDGGIVIRRAAPHFILAELFHGKSPREWRRAYANAYNWGPNKAERSSRNDAPPLFAGCRRSDLDRVFSTRAGGASRPVDDRRSSCHRRNSPRTPGLPSFVRLPREFGRSRPASCCRRVCRLSARC